MADSQTVGLAARRWHGVRESGRGALTLSHREKPAYRGWMQGGPRGRAGEQGAEKEMAA